MAKETITPLQGNHKALRDIKSVPVRQQALNKAQEFVNVLREARKNVKIDEEFLREMGNELALKSASPEETSFMIGFETAFQLMVYQMTEFCRRKMAPLAKELKNEDIKPLSAEKKAEIQLKLAVGQEYLGLVNRYVQREDEEETEGEEATA